MSILGRLLRLTNAGLAPIGFELKRQLPRHFRVEPYTHERINIERYAPWQDDADFQAVYARIRDFTLVDVYRCYELWTLVRHAVPGAIIEVGVWRGGTGAILAKAAQRWKPSAKVYLCDTFSGVVKAGAFDVAYRGGEHADTSIDMVNGLLSSLSLTNCEILQGIFPEESAARIPAGPVSICHIDVDVYESARDIVTWAASRMSAGALLVFDDYGFHNCSGVTRLVNELREDGRWEYFYNLNGHAILRRL